MYNKILKIYKTKYNKINSNANNNTQINKKLTNNSILSFKQ